MTGSRDFSQDYKECGIEYNKGIRKLNDEEIIIFFKKYSKNLNFDNKEISDYILENFNRDYPSKNQVDVFLKRSHLRKHKNPITKEYWISRGWTEKQFEEILKEQQELRRSTNSKSYWMKKGFSLEESEKKVSEEQSKRIQKFFDGGGEFSKESSHFNKEYWMTKRGLNEKESLQKISELQKVYSKLKKELPTNKRNTRIEYYLEKGMVQ